MSLSMYTLGGYPKCLINIPSLPLSLSRPCHTPNFFSAVVYENAVLSSGKPYAIALHSFHDTQTGDLSFNKGDLIELLGT